jgi:predicted nucleic acid-binding protein
MDNCCYFRLTDDQTQYRIAIEAQAVNAIIKLCEMGQVSIIGSDMLDFEMLLTKDDIKRNKMQGIYDGIVSERLKKTDRIKERAKNLLTLGFREQDATHIAFAESGNVDVYLTTDDKLLKCAESNDMKIEVKNPVNWIMEVLRNE